MSYTGFPYAFAELCCSFIRASFSLGVACNAISIQAEITCVAMYPQIEKSLINKYFCSHPFINEEKKVDAIFQDS